MSIFSDLKKENIAPYNASKIGVYNQAGVKVGVIPLGNLKVEYGERKYRFGVLSDVHHQTSQAAEPEADFRRALTHFNSKESVIMTCICGDITENCTVAELTTYKNNVNTYSGSTPVYTTVGNHDATSGGLNTSNWKTYTGCDRCFEFVQNTDRFLFFGMNTYSLGSSGNPYLNTDIDWLEAKLEEYRNERCFVFTHLFFPTRAGNLNNIYPSANWLGGAQLTRIQALNDRYRNSIWFSGHSHWKWYLQKYQDRANIYKENCGWTVHIPSCANPIDSDGTTRVSKSLESEGAIIDVYDNYIDIRAIDLKNEKYLPIGHYRLNTTLVDIPAKGEPTVTYTITNNLTNANSSNSATTINANDTYNATITPSQGFALDTAIITMGGTDITSTSYNNGVIRIESVTANVVITITTKEAEASGGIPAGYTAATAQMFSVRSGSPTVSMSGEYITINFTVKGEKFYFNDNFASNPSIYVESVTYEPSIDSTNQKACGFYIGTSNAYAIESDETGKYSFTAGSGLQFNISGSQYTAATPLKITMKNLAYKI